MGLKLAEFMVSQYGALSWNRYLWTQVAEIAFVPGTTVLEFHALPYCEPTGS